MKTLTVDKETKTKDKVELILPAYFKTSIGERTVYVYKITNEDLIEEIGTGILGRPGYSQAIPLSWVITGAYNVPATEEEWREALKVFKTHINSL